MPTVSAQTASQSHLALASKELLEEYIKKSGVDRQVAELSKSIPDSMEATLGEVKEISADRRRKIVEASRRVFSVSRMSDGIRAQLAKRVRAEDVKVINAFFDTAVGKHIVELDVAATTMNQDKLVQQAAELAETLPKEKPARYALLERFESAARLTESTVAMLENMSIAAMRATIATAGDKQVFNMDEARKLHVEQSKRMLGSLRPRMTATLAAMYAPLHDDELTRYVAMLESPGGRRLSESLSRAFSALFIELGAEMGRLLGERAA
jgi:hypothetical protein